jgi:hypothetical protein
MSKPIKSSIELAMEKAAKLPRLTDDEIRERQEREYGPVGQSIARGVLTGALAERRVETQLFEREDERGAIVRKSFSEFLCQSIDLEDAETTARALGAIRALVHDDDLERTASRLDDIARDYERQKRQELAAIEEAESARIRELGVSGSAIRINPRESERWQQGWSRLQQAFGPAADAIKQELNDHLVRGLEERS